MTPRNARKLMRSTLTKEMKKTNNPARLEEP
jgi:hypothetical protein